MERLMSFTFMMHHHLYIAYIHTYAHTGISASVAAEPGR